MARVSASFARWWARNAKPTPSGAPGSMQLLKSLPTTVRCHRLECRDKPLDSFSLRAIHRLQNSVAVIATRTSIANSFQTASRCGAQPVRCHFAKSVAIQNLGLKYKRLKSRFITVLGKSAGSASDDTKNIPIARMIAPPRESQLLPLLCKRHLHDGTGVSVPDVYMHGCRKRSRRRCPALPRPHSGSL